MAAKTKNSRPGFGRASDRTDGVKHIMKCPNCGAEFEVSESECPYCGYINPGGAEAKFMRGLEDKRRELDKVDDEAREDYKSEFKKDAGSTAKKIIIAAVIIGLLILGFIAMDRMIFNRNQDAKAEMVWEHENFPIYDEMYKNEEYEELMERIANDGEDGHSPWNWEDYDEFMAKAEELWG